jgi:hypothetical protein
MSFTILHMAKKSGSPFAQRSPRRGRPAAWRVLCRIFGRHFFQGFSEVVDVFALDGGPVQFSEHHQPVHKPEKVHAFRLTLQKHIPAVY